MSVEDQTAVEWPSPTITACPYPYYERLREEEPVHHVPGTNTYLISRWQDIAQVAQDARRFEQPEQFEMITPPPLTFE